MQFVGSAYDPVAPSKLNIDGNTAGKLVDQIFQGYITAKKIATAGDFDLSKFDLANTIFTLWLGPGFSMVTKKKKTIHIIMIHLLNLCLTHTHTHTINVYVTCRRVNLLIVVGTLLHIILSMV